jgi:hypothetical protein
MRRPKPAALSLPVELRLWLRLIRSFVPRDTRDEWLREWLAECAVVLENEGRSDSYHLTLAAYAAGALPDALTARLLALADSAHWIFRGVRLLVAQPLTHLVALVMLTLPIAASVVLFQCARASVASRSLNIDVGVLMVAGLTVAAALTWTSARGVASVLSATAAIAGRADIAARYAAAVVVAATLAVPLVASGLTRIAPPVLRGGGLAAESFRFDVLTGLAWAVASYAAWKLRAR